MTTLADRLVLTRNRPAGFDWMRLLLSTSIIVWHTNVLSYGLDAERYYLTSPFWRPPVVAILGLFFSLSGFLVAGSLERCRTVISFAGLRIFRIFPALVVEVLLSALILGPLLTHSDLHAYFRSWTFKVYFFNTLGIVHFVLPGVFPNNPLPNIVNGQLWTVPFELKCYEILLLIAVLGFYRKKIFLIGSLLLSISYVLSQDCFAGCVSKDALQNYQLILSGDELVLCFLLGVALFRFRDRVIWSAWLGAVSAAAAIALLAFPIPGGLSLAPIPFAYLTTYLGLLNPPKIKLLFSGDYSYGLYLYGFPIQQAVASIGSWTHHWYINLAMALPLAGAVAFVSWTYVEKPFLSRKAVLNRLEDGFLAASSLTRLRFRQAARLIAGQS
jgi:peptidoglycan/LPS O-acetylase OafA/YrhL